MKIPLSPDVIGVATRLGAIDLIETASDLIVASFPTMIRVDSYVEYNHDGPADLIVLDVEVHGDGMVGVIAEQFRNFSTKWRAAVPRDKWHLIQVIYTIV